ncbi:MAG: hypothetical protein ACYC5N_11045, partial [Endomicrobiales bacterium]
MMKKTVRILVPATTANLGPGFDVLGAALNLHNEISVTRQGNGRGIRIEIEGEGRDTLPRDARNIVWQSMKRAFGALRDRALRNTLLRGSYAILLVN